MKTGDIIIDKKTGLEYDIVGTHDNMVTIFKDGYYIDALKNDFLIKKQNVFDKIFICRIKSMMQKLNFFN